MVRRNPSVVVTIATANSAATTTRIRRVAGRSGRGMCDAASSRAPGRPRDHPEGQEREDRRTASGEEAGAGPEPRVVGETGRLVAEKAATTSAASPLS